MMIKQQKRTNEHGRSRQWPCECNEQNNLNRWTRNSRLISSLPLCRSFFLIVFASVSRSNLCRQQYYAWYLSHSSPKYVAFNFVLALKPSFVSVCYAVPQHCAVTCATLLSISTKVAIISECLALFSFWFSLVLLPPPPSLLLLQQQRTLYI